MSEKMALSTLKPSIDGLALVGGKNLVGPFYSAVGRTWQQTAEEREHDMKILVEILRDLAEYAAKKVCYPWLGTSQSV